MLNQDYQASIPLLKRIKANLIISRLKNLKKRLIFDSKLHKPAIHRLHENQIKVEEEKKFQLTIIKNL